MPKPQSQLTFSKTRTNTNPPLTQTRMYGIILPGVSPETELHKKQDHSVSSFGAPVLRRIWGCYVKCLVTSIQEGLWVVFVVGRGLLVSPEHLGAEDTHSKHALQLSRWLLLFDSNSILSLLEMSPSYSGSSDIAGLWCIPSTHLLFSVLYSFCSFPLKE